MSKLFQYSFLLLIYLISNAVAQTDLKDSYQLDREKASFILKSVLVTNAPNGIYITHKKNLEDGTHNNAVRVSIKFREFTALESDDQAIFNISSKQSRIVDTSSDWSVIVPIDNPDGQYFTGLNENMKYFVTAIASTDSGIELRKSFMIDYRKMDPSFMTTNGEKIIFEPEKSVLVLLDFIIDNDDMNPRYHIVHEFRKFGIPILHHLHEFIDQYGISPILLPLGFADQVVRNDNQTIEHSLSEFGRKDFDTIFVMGYGTSVCALYTRPNSVNHLVDMYPDKNIIVIEDGTDNGQYQAKWAISQMRDFTKTVRAIAVLEAMGLPTKYSLLVKRANYLNAIADMNDETRQAIERLSLDKHRKDLQWINKNIDNTVLVISNINEVSDDDVLKNIKKIEKIYSGFSMNIIEINNNLISLNGQTESLEMVFKFINDEKLIPVITGYLNNDTKIWRAGFPGDFYKTPVAPQKILQDSIFIRDATLARTGSPFSDLGFTHEESRDILIERASLYSDSGWISVNDFFKHLSN